MWPTPVAGEHQLVGPALEVTFVPNLSPLKDTSVCVRTHRGGISPWTPLPGLLARQPWVGRGCALLSPHCYLRAPHHRVSGQRAGGGIGPVSQLSLNRERGGAVRAQPGPSGHAVVLSRGSVRHAKSARGQERMGTCAPGLGACQQKPQGGRYGSQRCFWPAAVLPLTTRWW